MALKTVRNILLFFIGQGALIGFVYPFLFSAKSTEAVLLGLLLLVLNLYGLCWQTYRVSNKTEATRIR